MATLALNGEVHVHTLSSFVGKWNTAFNLSEELQSYLKSNCWFQTKKSNYSNSTKKENQAIKKMKEHLRRKHMLYITCLCWCPNPLSCTVCLKNSLPENIYYTSYFLNYANCCHSNNMLCMASKSGYLYFWKLTFNKSNPSECRINLAHMYETGMKWPVSISWHVDEFENGKFFNVILLSMCIFVFLFSQRC